MGEWKILEKSNKLGNQGNLDGEFRLMIGIWEKYTSNRWKLNIFTLVSVLVNIISCVQLYPKTLTIWLS